MAFLTDFRSGPALAAPPSGPRETEDGTLLAPAVEGPARSAAPPARPVPEPPASRETAALVGVGAPDPTLAGGAGGLSVRPAPPAAPPAPGPVPGPVQAPTNGWPPPGGGQVAAPPPYGRAAPGWTAPGWATPPAPWPVAAAPRRSRRGVVAVAVAASLAVVGAAGAVIATSRHSQTLAGMAPQAALEKSLEAAARAGSAHAVDTSGSGAEQTRSTIDFSATGGKASMLRGSSGAAQMMVVGRSIYFKADADTLGGMLGIDPDGAQEYSYRWLEVPVANADLRRAALAFETPTIISDLLSLGGPVTEDPSPPPGEVVFHGTIPDNSMTADSGGGDPATLTVSSHYPFLPISLSYTDPEQGPDTTVFSDWGEQVQLTQPTDAIPLPGGAGGGAGGSSAA